MSIEAMKQALEELQYVLDSSVNEDLPLHANNFNRTIKLLKQAIEQAESDKARFDDFVSQLKEVEKQACEIINREWVGLTDDDMYELRRKGHHHLSERDFRAIEAKLREKNAYGWQSVENPTQYLDDLRGGDAT